MDTNKKALHPVLTLRLFTEEKCFGPGIAALLQGVRQRHSLRSAAMDMNMAYSKAWSILRASEEALGCKLLHSTTGGKNGGGASLTPEGTAILEAYTAYRAEMEEQGERLFQKYFGELPLPVEKE